MNRYLINDPVDYLLEDSNPVIRYLTLRDIASGSAGVLENSYRKLKESPIIQSLLTNVKTGLPGDTRNITAPGRGSAWMLARAVAMGLDSREPLIVRTFDAIFQNHQTPSGGISNNWKPGHPDACLTGEIARIALAAGINTHPVKSAIQWIIDHQRHDGGWLYSPGAGWPGMLAHMFLNRVGFGLTLEEKSTVNSCMISSISCAMALMLAAPPEIEPSSVLKKSVNFFLDKKLLLSNNRTVITPQNIRANRSNVTSIGYPVFCQYDLLYGLLFIARAGSFNHPGTGEAFNTIISRQTEKGTLPYDNFQNGMIISGKNQKKETPNDRDKWTTLNFLRLLLVTGDQ